MTTPLLGFIEPEFRTQQQYDAHVIAVSRMMADPGLTPVTLAKGEKVILSNFFNKQEVIADMGMKFPGFRQLTGSCVGVTLGGIIALHSAIQRMIADAPTKAFIPWWPFTYGRTRYNEGDRGQGEGAVSSVAGDTLDKEGTFARSEVPSLPEWDTRDGLALTSKLEYSWSDGGSSLVKEHLPLGATHTSNAKSIVRTVDQIVTGIANGYPTANGCAYYIGSGSIRGEGADAYVRGTYGPRGGHETHFAGAWHHPNDGLLLGYINTWEALTYPRDPAGLPRCSLWVPADDVQMKLNAGWNGIADGEAWMVSHIDYFPAQVDKIFTYKDI